MVSISIQTRILYFIYVHERTFYAHEDADSNRHHVRALSIKKFARRRWRTWNGAMLFLTESPSLDGCQRMNQWHRCIEYSDSRAKKRDKNVKCESLRGRFFESAAKALPARFWKGQESVTFSVRSISVPPCCTISLKGIHSSS